MIRSTPSRVWLASCWAVVALLVSRGCSLSQSRRGRRGPLSSTGFGTSSQHTKTATKNKATDKQGAIYSKPELYDLAFGYRNYEEEVAFLVSQHQILNGGQGPSSVLELASGPSRHSIQALRSSLVEGVTAVDNCPSMTEYASNLAQVELGDGSASFQMVNGDMRSFQVKDKIDSIWLLLGSLQHLTENDDVIACFKCAQRALSDGGTFVLELPHPRETFSLVECTRNGWQVPLEDDNGMEYGELDIIWGDDDDEFDPITQVRQFTVALELKGVPQEQRQSVREIVPMRHFTAQEIDLFAKLTGFKVASMHGALAYDVDINDEDASYRMVCVLQKIPHKDDLAP